MSEKPLVLVLAEHEDPELRLLEAVPHVIGKDASFAEAGKEAQAIFYWTGSRDLLRTVFLAAPQVRWIHTRNAGIDNILFPELIESDVPLTNAAGIFSQSLGEFALGAMIYFAKDFPRMLRNQRASRWEHFLVDAIEGQTVGIVGYGDIGRAVARRAHAMGMKVLATKRHFPKDADPLVEQFYHPHELRAMIARCDYAVISAPLTPETRHMMGAAEFAVMKPNAVLINIGRGPVVDQAALVRTLEEGRIKGAALDVFEVEPLAADSPLWKFENALISPHSADRTHDWLERTVDLFLRQYERFAAGRPLENIVQKRLGY